MKRVLGVNGSPRKGSNSDMLLRYMLEGVAAEGGQVEGIRLRDYYFQSCNGCEKCRKDGSCTGLNDGMQLIYPKIRESHGLILVSPVHNYNVTAIMKAFIDRLYSFYNFAADRPGQWSSQLSGEGRKAIIAIIGEQTIPEEGGANLALEALRRPYYRGVIGVEPFCQGQAERKAPEPGRSQILGQEARRFPESGLGHYTSEEFMFYPPICSLFTREGPSPGLV